MKERFPWERLWPVLTYLPQHFLCLYPAAGFIPLALQELEHACPPPQEIVCNWEQKIIDRD